MRRKCERITRKFRTCPGRFAHRISTYVYFHVLRLVSPVRRAFADSAEFSTHDTRLSPRKNQTKRREPEELEAEREETDDEVTGGGGSSSVFESSSSSYATRTYGGSGVSSPDIFPEAVSFPFGSSGFLTGFPFGGWLDGGGGAESRRRGDAQHPASPPSFFGAMATVFRGMYEFAREMERLEKGEEKQRRAAERETETAPAARNEDE